MRDQIVDFVRRWSQQTEIGAGRFIDWLGIAPSKFYSWRRRYGCLNEHNGWVPRDFWLEEWEKQAIVEFYQKNSLEGYRRLIEGDKFYTTYRGERLELPKDSGEGLAEYLRAAAALDASP